jgi:hypothetical protein
MPGCLFLGREKEQLRAGTAKAVPGWDTLGPTLQQSAISLQTVDNSMTQAMIAPD